MFGTQFSHYLSYGASDQETVTELRKPEVYDGLLVPGTVAAFQKEGTGGFVLSLSASSARIPYAIDPRSPLFQQELVAPKKSHESLARILGLPEDYEPVPESFTDSLVETIAANWVNFNGKYQEEAGGKFAKYAKRLGEEGLVLDSASPPHIILPPYFVANSVDDPWWSLTTKIYDATCNAARQLVPDKKCIRVVATEHATALDGLCGALAKDAELVVWVSDLNELRATASELVAYGEAIEQAEKRGQKVFGLYGGFFSVLLGSTGLRGISHGIGYGESRNWIELPQSGPPPKRYYVEPFHRYVSQEFAERLWKAGIYRCECPVCGSTSPLLLEYHDVMKHSVYVRHKEISEWAVRSISECYQLLTKECAELTTSLANAKLEKIHQAKADDATRHLPTWLFALNQIASE